MQKNDFQSFEFIIECEYHCIVATIKKKKKINTINWLFLNELNIYKIDVNFIKYIEWIKKKCITIFLFWDSKKNKRINT